MLHITIMFSGWNNTSENYWGVNLLTYLQWRMTEQDRIKRVVQGPHWRQHHDTAHIISQLDMSKAACNNNQTTTHVTHTLSNWRTSSKLSPWFNIHILLRNWCCHLLYFICIFFLIYCFWFTHLFYYPAQCSASLFFMQLVVGALQISPHQITTTNIITIRWKLMKINKKTRTTRWWAWKSISQYISNLSTVTNNTQAYFSPIPIWATLTTSVKPESVNQALIN